jgi:hypothetical protein
MYNIFGIYYQLGLFSVLTWLVSILIPICIYFVFKFEREEALKRLIPSTIPTLLIPILFWLISSEIPHKLVDTTRGFVAYISIPFLILWFALPYMDLAIDLPFGQLFGRCSSRRLKSFGREIKNNTFPK